MAPRFLRKHVFSLINCFPEHNYLYHDASLPLPQYVKDIEFDAILLDVTFLCARWAGKEYFQRRLAEYAFVAQSSAVKLAFPQDEYDCNEILDRWMCDWNIDVVFSVIASNQHVLYPNFHKQGQIHLGFTGYLDGSLVNYQYKPFQLRPIDIGYRARKLPPYFGRIGETKWTIGRDVERQAEMYGLHTDIVLGPEGTLLGDKWISFINDSKFTLGANSGSSLLDPVGSIQRTVRSYVDRNPRATFEEVEAACFYGLDGQYEFTAISPRVLEAAMLGSCQILVEGEYSGILRPWEHYIPIKNDASDFSIVFSAMQDQTLVNDLIRSCREAILATKSLSYENNASQVLTLIRELRTKRSTGNGKDVDIGQVTEKYKKEMVNDYKKMWRKQKAKMQLKRLLESVPAGKRLISTLRKVRNI